MSVHDSDEHDPFDMECPQIDPEECQRILDESEPFAMTGFGEPHHLRDAVEIRDAAARLTFAAWALVATNVAVIVVLLSVGSVLRSVVAEVQILRMEMADTVKKTTSLIPGGFGDVRTIPRRLPKIRWRQEVPRRAVVPVDRDEMDGQVDAVQASMDGARRRPYVARSDCRGRSCIVAGNLETKKIDTR